MDNGKVLHQKEFNKHYHLKGIKTKGGTIIIVGLRITWIGRQTEKIKLGIAFRQMTSRTPANTAMTLDQLSARRLLLDLGWSGPQVGEGWYDRSFRKVRVSGSNRGARDA